MAELIHIVLNDLTVGSVRRQRCAWCGELISEYDLANIAVQVDREGQPDDADLAPGLWQGLVARDGAVSWSVPEPEDGKVPPTSCMAMPFEETR